MPVMSKGIDPRAVLSVAKQEQRAPSQEQGGEKRYVYKRTNWPGEPGEIVLFAKDNKGYTQKQWDGFEDFIKRTRGQVPDELMKVPAASLRANLQAAFETVNQPVQQGAQALSNMPDAPGGGLSSAAYNLGKRLAPGIAESVNTLPKAGAAGAAAVTSGTTGGLSIPLRMLLTALTTSITHYGAETALGDLAENKEHYARLKSALATGAIYSAGEGLFGIFNKVLGRMMSKAGARRFAGNVVDVVKSEYGDVAGQGMNTLNAIASTETGAKKLVQAGIKTVRGNADDLAATLVNDIETSLGGELGGRLKPSLKLRTERFAKQYAGAAERYLDNYGKKGAEAAFKKSMREVRDNMQQEVLSLIKADKPRKIAEEGVRAVLEQFYNDALGYQEVAEVLAITRASIDSNGFNMGKFQTMMSDRIGGGEMLSKLRGSAQRVPTMQEVKGGTISSLPRAMPKMLGRDIWRGMLPVTREVGPTVIPRSVRTPVLTGINDYLKR